MEINLAWMYPDILNLHGERGSVQAFEKVAKNLGATLNVKRIDSFNEQIDYENIDIMLFLPSELKVIPTIKEALDKEKINKYVEDNKYLICVGTTGALLANETTREDGTKVEGLGILDMVASERKMVIGDDLHFYIEETKQEIMGSQIQMLDITRQNVDALRLYYIWIWKLRERRRRCKKEKCFLYKLPRTSICKKPMVGRKNITRHYNYKSTRHK